MLGIQRIRLWNLRQTILIRFDDQVFGQESLRGLRPWRRFTFPGITMFFRRNRGVQRNDRREAGDTVRPSL